MSHNGTEDSTKLLSNVYQKTEVSVPVGRQGKHERRMRNSGGVRKVLLAHIAWETKLQYRTSTGVWAHMTIKAKCAGSALFQGYAMNVLLLLSVCRENNADARASPCRCAENARGVLYAAPLRLKNVEEGPNPAYLHSTGQPTLRT